MAEAMLAQLTDLAKGKKLPYEVQSTMAGEGPKSTDANLWLTGQHYQPPLSYSPTYDLRGNLTGDARWTYTWDARWTYTWDAENRLIAMEERDEIPVGVGVVATRVRLEFDYDAESRRTAKRVKHWKNGACVFVNNIAFAYDRWNLMLECQQGPNFGNWQPVRMYLWGDDISNTEQGAGGVGGLLAVRRLPAAGPGPALLIPFYGANGNITAWLDGSEPPPAMSPDLKAVARWNYLPYGERYGDEAKLAAELCPIGFSTKYEDVETGLYYYGYRYYSAAEGRWLSRDPIGEAGGLNLYQKVGNDSVNQVDILGLKSFTSS